MQKAAIQLTLKNTKKGGGDDMYITTTKTFTRWIKQNVVKNSTTINDAIFTEFERACDYEFTTGGDGWQDLNTKTGYYSAIKIVYNDDCYAMPAYLTAESLAKTCHRIKRAGLALTTENLKNALINELEI